MTAETLTYFAQDISSSSVFKEKRKSTNKVVGFIFAASFLLWIAVVVYGMNLPKQRTSSGFTFDFGQLDNTRILNISGFILLSAVFTFIAFVILRWMPHITKLTLHVYWIKVAYIMLMAHYLIPSSYIEWVGYYIMRLLLGSFLTFLIVGFLLMQEFFTPEKVLREACKMVASVPSTLVFALYSSLLTVFLTVILVEVNVKLFSTHITNIEVILIFINFICGSWTIITLFTLNMMTLNGRFAEYWVERKNSVSPCTILHHFGINLRYHIGTAAMHYPLLGGISALIYLVKQAVSFESWSCERLLFNVVDTILLRIMLLGTAATCSMKGKNFYESMTYTMALFMHNPRKVFEVCTVLEMILASTTVLVVLFTSLSTFAYLTIGFTPSSAGILRLNHLTTVFDLNSWEMQFWIVVTMGATVLAVALLQCLCAACCSTILTFQEEEFLWDSRTAWMVHSIHDFSTPSHI